MDTSVAKTFTITVTAVAPTLLSLVGTYNGSLMIPNVGHYMNAVLTITSQTASGAFVGSLTASPVAVKVSGQVNADGTFTMALAPDTAHLGGAIVGTGSGSLDASGKMMSVNFNFTKPAVMPGSLDVTKQ